MSVEATAIAVREYAGSEQSKLLDSLLSQMIKGYHEELESAEGLRITQLQVAIKQSRSLQAVINGRPHSDPRV